MKTTLYLCEKPSQARDIARVLGVTHRQEGYIEGNGIIVTWCLGHLLSLAPPETYCEKLKPWRMEILPVFPEVWERVPNKKTQSQLRIIKKLLTHANCVIIATDADREGDVIGREVLDYYHYQGEVKRLWLSALDDTSIQQALATIKPSEATYPLYQAGLGRQRADWAIGMNMTMAVSCLFGQAGQGVLSVGRVQTPTLALVVNRDREIQQFTPREFFVLSVQFDALNGAFVAQWQVPDCYADATGHCTDNAIINRITECLNEQTGVVSEFSETKKKTPPPACLSLSTLQKIGSSRWGLTAKQTLKIAQSLYETHKATTYPRTDTGFLPSSQFADAKTVLAAIGKVDKTLQPLLTECDTTLMSPTWNDKKVTAHHGIIPTSNTQVDMSAMSADERRVYDCIRQHYIAQFLGDYTYRQRNVTVQCENETFTASHNQPCEQGWKRAMENTVETADSTEEQPEITQTQPIPSLTIGDAVSVKQTLLDTKRTQPPPRFTEGTLIAAMKNIAKFVTDVDLKKTLRDTAGIGTEATRADIIEKLLQRGFLQRKKKQLVATERGGALIDILPVQMKDPATTAIWEQALDDIATGKGDLETFIADQQDILAMMLMDISSIHQNDSHRFADDTPTYPCSQCQSPLTKRHGKKGD